MAGGDGRHFRLMPWAVSGLHHLLATEPLQAISSQGLSLLICKMDMIIAPTSRCGNQGRLQDLHRPAHRRCPLLGTSARGQWEGSSPLSPPEHLTVGQRIWETRHLLAVGI